MEFAERPIAVTMGDPAGIGPELIAKMFLRRPQLRNWITVGDPLVMAAAFEQLGERVRLRTITSPDEAKREPGTLDVLRTSQCKTPPLLGRVAAECGHMSFQSVVQAVSFARDRQVRAIVTAPINKSALALAGLPFAGHTEILAKYGGAAKVAMMLCNAAVRTVLVTTHCSMADAISRADIDAQLNAITFAQFGAQLFGIRDPRIAVAGLNPHAGEDGQFGDEELRIIGPAIEIARAKGIDASGPWPGDTIFLKARQGLFDVVVAQYHDQGLIPIKFLGLESGVNITLGLPFIRTSPDHGTAYDIAGRGIADPASLEAAFDCASGLAASRLPEMAA